MAGSLWGLAVFGIYLILRLSFSILVLSGMRLLSVCLNLIIFAKNLPSILREITIFYICSLGNSQRRYEVKGWSKGAMMVLFLFYQLSGNFGVHCINEKGAKLEGF